jgi:hypothetical protein
MFKIGDVVTIDGVEFFEIDHVNDVRDRATAKALPHRMGFKTLDPTTGLPYVYPNGMMGPVTCPNILNPLGRPFRLAEPIELEAFEKRQQVIRYIDSIHSRSKLVNHQGVVKLDKMLKALKQVSKCL